MRRASRRCSGSRYRPRARREAPSPLRPNVLGSDEGAMVAAAAPPHRMRCPCSSALCVRRDLFNPFDIETAMPHTSEYDRWPYWMAGAVTLAWLGMYVHNVA